MTDPVVTAALITMAGTVVASLIAATGAVLVARYQYRGKRREQAAARGDRELAERTIQQQREEIEYWRWWHLSCPSCDVPPTVTRWIVSGGKPGSSASDASRSDGSPPSAPR